MREHFVVFPFILNTFFAFGQRKTFGSKITFDINSPVDCLLDLVG